MQSFNNFKMMELKEAKWSSGRQVPGYFLNSFIHIEVQGDSEGLRSREIR